MCEKCQCKFFFFSLLEIIDIVDNYVLSEIASFVQPQITQHKNNLKDSFLKSTHHLSNLLASQILN